jgi:alkylation response protein AidB-like acyl-CoA dehydrogenase
MLAANYNHIGHQGAYYYPGQFRLAGHGGSNGRPGGQRRWRCEQVSESMIGEAAARIFQDLCAPSVVNAAESGIWPGALWQTLEESGTPLGWVPAELGGSGADLSDGFALVRAGAKYSCPVPLAETLLAGWLLAGAQIECPAGPMSIAALPRDSSDIRVNEDGMVLGEAKDVRFGRYASHIAVLARRRNEQVVALVPAVAIHLRLRVNLAGEPSDDITFNDARATVVHVAPDCAADRILRLGAAMRAQQMAGALERILDLSVQHAIDRTQFGRPIGKFQAVQHNLAMLASEAAAAGAAADVAAEKIAGLPDVDERCDGIVAVAKVRAGEAATAGAAIAHQIHGAIGFTYEHSLHQSTRRLWAWREDFGNEAFWAARLGRLVTERGAAGLWPFLTANLGN